MIRSLFFVLQLGVRLKWGIVVPGRGSLDHESSVAPSACPHGPVSSFPFLGPTGENLGSEIRVGAAAESPKVAGHGLAVCSGWGWGILLDVALGVSLNWSFLFLQVARKLVILEGELERAEERAEVSEL